MELLPKKKHGQKVNKVQARNSCSSAVANSWHFNLFGAASLEKEEEEEEVEKNSVEGVKILSSSS